jgi:zinc protease
MKSALAILAMGWVCVSMPALGAASCARAQASAAQAAEAMPTVDQVLDKYVRALGGRSAIEKLKTRVMKGKVEVPGTGESGTTEIYQKAPDKGFFLIVIPSNGPTPRAFNGKAGWAVDDPDEGVKDVAPSELPAMRREFDFYREIRLKELYPQMSLKGREKIGGRDAWFIEATAPDGALERMYFDAQTGLLARHDTPYVTEDGRGFVQTLFEDYREVDGVKVPFVWRQASADFEYVFRFDQVQHNVPVEDAKFEKPAN